MIEQPAPQSALCSSRLVRAPAGELAPLLATTLSLQSDLGSSPSLCHPPLLRHPSHSPARAKKPKQTHPSMPIHHLSSSSPSCSKARAELPWQRKPTHHPPWTSG